MTGNKIDIRGIIKGDREVFRKVYLLYYDMIYHLCMEYIHNAQISQELVQDTFMKLWEVRAKINTDTNLGNFLYTIAKNKCLNYLRDQATIQRAQRSQDYLEFHLNIEALQGVGDQWIHYDELKLLIEKVIDRMPQNIKKVFIMSRYEDLKYKEISQQLDISVKTVEVRISKALLILRKAIHDYNSSVL